MFFDTIEVIGKFSPTNQLILRTIRKLGVFSKLVGKDNIVLNNSTKGFVITEEIDLSSFNVPILNLNEVVIKVSLENTLKEFIKKTKASPNWSLENYLIAQDEEIKKLVGTKQVLMGISGGVDSTVASFLIAKALPNQLTCLFVDHGLLRENEALQVMQRYHEIACIKVHKIDAQSQFLEKLKIIGKEFINTFASEAKKLGNFSFLGQGTIYPDLIESGKDASLIKSHHNVGGLPKDLPFLLLEPLKYLFKDEVRSLGLLLGLDKEFINRQPFPGPGLAVRILGEVNKETLFLAKKSNQILEEEFAKAGLNESVWQYFTVVPKIYTVGIKENKRVYEQAIVIRAVNSVEGMVADWAKIPYPVLGLISKRITSEIPGVNRVLYDITPKPPATIEWE